jgi:DNA polymerase III subunit beta
MKLTIQREDILGPLQIISGAVEKRQTLPILSNVLLSVQGQSLSFTATDLEIEVIGRASLGQQKKAEDGEITVEARKLIDICRALPDGAIIEMLFEKGRAILRSGKSRFVLSTLPAEEFPSVEEKRLEGEGFFLPQKELKKLIEKTHFAMAQQDVRYYLNGMLFELKQGVVRLVATDGHRLSSAFLASPSLSGISSSQIIIPRKGVLELMRLLEDEGEDAKISIGANHIRVEAPSFTFTSKLIEGKFPNYDKVVPKGGKKEVIIDRDVLKRALTRVSILSNETYRGVRVFLTSGGLSLSANNPEQEEAEEDVAINYKGADLEIGFNVGYLIDICNIASSSSIKMTFSDTDGGVLVEEEGDDRFVYVVMPMLL